MEYGVLAIGEAGIILGLVTGIPIALVLIFWTRWRDRKNIPNGQRRIELMATLRRMADQGNSYEQRLTYLCGEGLRRNVAEGLITDVERKQPADVSSTKTASRGGLSFQYPGNWRLHDLDEKMDPETNFCVEALSSAICIFTVRSHDGPPLDDIDTLAAGQSARLKDAVERPFDRWGSLSGQGRLITGTILNVLPIEVYVLRCEIANGTALAVVRSCMDEDREDATPGFELIERTLKLEA